jgi:hypothetical protein
MQEIPTYSSLCNLQMQAKCKRAGDDFRAFRCPFSKSPSAYRRVELNRGYSLLWRKIWSNPVLADPGRKFSRLEAWLYIITVLASGKEDKSYRLRRGEFSVSSRYLVRAWNWPRANVQRFFRELEKEGMIARIGDREKEQNAADTGLSHLAGQSAGRQPPLYCPELRDLQPCAGH